MNAEHVVRVAFANTFMAPYRIPLYADLAATPGWDLMVYLSCAMEFDRQWQTEKDVSFSYKASFNLSYKRRVHHAEGFQDVKQIHLPIGLWFDLWVFRPDVVISNEMGARSLLAAVYAYMTGKPFVLMWEVSMHADRDSNRTQRILRKLFSRISHAFIATGSEAKIHLESLGVESGKIFLAYNAVDTALFQQRFSEDNRSAMRSKLGVSGLCYLCVSNLIPRKGLDQLIKAWQIFCEQLKGEVTLLLVGEGDQKEHLKEMVKSLGLQNVKFIGFLGYNEMPFIYHAADVFVFPTLEDVWGLVINEALAAGLPVLSSKYAGCTADLVVEGVNGWVIDPLDRDDIVGKLRMSWDNRSQNEKMKKAGREIIAEINIATMAEGIRNAVQYVLSKKAERRHALQ